MESSSSQSKAFRRLVLCTAVWALSFPVMKALALLQQGLAPEGSSWFFASLCVVYRFGASAFIMALMAMPILRQTTRSEIQQGVGLGLFGGAGILLQMDGLARTPASVSAFLTQCYCILIPLWVAYWEGRWPSRRIGMSCWMVLVGTAVLANFDWRHWQLGRGEAETLAAAVFFTGQILWLERPAYAGNHPDRFSVVMFAVMSLTGLPLAVVTAPHWSDCVRVYQVPAAIGCLGLLVMFCTLGGYVLMNRWQRHLPATQAGLIYCLEPVFASLYACFMPGWFSTGTGIQYANEIPTPHLLIGGGLILGANILARR
jgi:drug/metabolite transporter (DMT)-like permease